VGLHQNPFPAKLRLTSRALLGKEFDDAVDFLGGKCFLVTPSWPTWPPRFLPVGVEVCRIARSCGMSEEGGIEEFVELIRSALPSFRTTASKSRMRASNSETRDFRPAFSRFNSAFSRFSSAFSRFSASFSP